MNIIDYSQTKDFLTCPYLWYEKYVRRIQRQWPAAQRDDALALGALVHAGLEAWHERQEPEIPQSVVEEMAPTAECMATARQLVLGYIRQYPGEQWEVQRCEEPVRFPIYDPQYSLCGLAKIDRYFHLPELTTIDSGVEGYQLSLSPGWWISEYKTKSPYVPRPAWIKKWQTNLQASFQCLALRGRVGEYPQGVLISVLEKPKEYIPKRKCKGCGETYEYAAYLLLQDNEYACPVCGYAQRLSPIVSRVERAPSYFRHVAVRTAERLERDLSTIRQIALAMEEMRERGPEAIFPNYENCVNEKWGRECDYFQFHSEGLEASPGPGFVQIENPLAYTGVPI